MAEITDTFDQPFSLLDPGAVVQTFSPSAIVLNGRPYLINTTNDPYGNARYKRDSVDVLQQRNTTDSRDAILMPQEVWRQAVSGWHQGAGQSNLDRDNALAYRFSKSYGIDPWTLWQVSLLPATAQLSSLANANPTFLEIMGSYLVDINGTTLRWWTALSGTPVSLTVGSSTIIDSSSSGEQVTTLDSAGKVYHSTSPTVTTLFKSLTSSATALAWVKDYLIVGDGNLLKDITGTTSTIYTHPLSGFRWKDFCEGPQAIYALGGSGDKYVVHKVTIKTDGTGLNPAIVAVQLPDGEIGYSMGSYLGYVFIGTNKGVRMAQPDQNGDLTLGSLLPTDTPVYGFEGQDRFVWYTNSSIDPSFAATAGDVVDIPTSPVCGLGRMDLSTFTTGAFTPAYANDLVASTVSSKTVQSVVTFLGRRVFSITNGGIHYETTNLMPAGCLTQGTMSFNVEDLKTGLYMQGKWLPLNGSIFYDVSFDSSGYTRFARRTNAGSIRSDNMPFNGAQFSRVEVRYVLQRDSTTATLGPIMTRWEMRAFPVKGSSSRWTIPVMNYDQVEIDGVSYVRDVKAELDLLIDLYETGGLFSLQESSRSYLVSARSYEWHPEKLSSNGKGWQGVFNLVVEEVA